MKKTIYSIKLNDLIIYLMRSDIQFIIYNQNGTSLKYEDAPKTARIKKLSIKDEKMHIQIVY